MGEKLIFFSNCVFRRNDVGAGAADVAMEITHRTEMMLKTSLVITFVITFATLVTAAAQTETETEAETDR
jgi:hypothetical protein